MNELMVLKSANVPGKMEHSRAGIPDNPGQKINNCVSDRDFLSRIASCHDSAERPRLGIIFTAEPSTSGSRPKTLSPPA
jgi:hypothetical protein